MMRCLTDDLRICSIITKKLLSSEGKEFGIGNDINFTLCRTGKEYSCFGIIEDIADESFRIGKVEVDGMRLLDEIDIDLAKLKMVLFIIQIMDGVNSEMKIKLKDESTIETIPEKSF